MTKSEQPPQDDQTIADRLNALFSDVPSSRDGGPSTNEEISTRARGLGYDLSPAYIAQIRRGVRKNPTVRALQGLAAAFGVAPSYFFTEVRPAEARTDQALTAIVADDVVRDIALRSAQLSPEGARTIIAVLKNLEALPDVKRYEPPKPDKEHS